MIIVEGTYQDAAHLGLINLRIDRFEATDFVPNGVVFLQAIGYAVQASDETQTEIEVEITIPDLFYEDTWDDQVVWAHIISHIQSLGFNAYEQVTRSTRIALNEEKEEQISIKLPWYTRLWNKIKNFFNK